MGANKPILKFRTWYTAPATSAEKEAAARLQKALKTKDPTGEMMFLQTEVQHPPLEGWSPAPDMPKRLFENAPPLRLSLYGKGGGLESRSALDIDKAMDKTK